MSFFFSRASMPVVEPILSLIEQMPVTLSSGLKRPEHEAGYSDPVPRLRTSGPVPPLPHMPSWLAQGQLFLVLSRIFLYMYIFLDR